MFCETSVGERETVILVRRIDLRSDVKNHEESVGTTWDGRRLYKFDKRYEIMLLLV